MKKNYKRKKAKGFTYIEIMLVLLIVGIILVATINTGKIRINSNLNKYMYYSAFNSLMQSTSALLAEGCIQTDVDNHYCTALSGYLPKIANDTANSTRGLCNRLAELFNTVGPVDCTQTATDSTNFKTATPNFIASNGMRFFNFGTAPTGTDPNYNYTVYVDIDGASARNSVLNEDVMKYRIYTTGGIVVPDADPTDDKGATSTDYLSASVRYLDDVTSKYKYVESGINYISAYCVANGSYPTGTACPITPIATVATYNANCAPATNHICTVIVDKPKFSIF